MYTLDVGSGSLALLAAAVGVAVVAVNPDGEAVALLQKGIGGVV